MTPLSPKPAPRQRATMKDVAREAGVGIKTVSRVVNGEGYVGEATAARVRAAVELLSYRRDVSAGSLRRADRRTLSIGLLLGDVSNPFDAQVHRGVEDAASAAGFAVLSASLDEDPERERELVPTMASYQVDGLIVMPAGPDPTALQHEIDAGMPIVLVDRGVDGLETDSVVVDNESGARIATEHLISYGHRHIAFMGDRQFLPTAQKRLDGYRQACWSAGCPATHVIQDLSNEYLAETATRAMLQSSPAPTAIFAAQNLVTIGAVRALRSLGLEHEIAVVGFDDITLGDLVSPAISVIAQDPHLIGRMAAERLLARIGGDTSPVQQIVVPTSFLVRGSGEIPPP
ncbi:LacI family DNA-binding transcriptional regulator [Aeromicrobium sp.]|uniref:LacI family DNA-binding transcriptional regulator n=1 Tax=Aeromicrobium sp. TaxID=1871063 RepID=UPI002FC79844